MPPRSIQDLNQMIQEAQSNLVNAVTELTHAQGSLLYYFSEPEKGRKVTRAIKQLSTMILEMDALKVNTGKVL